MKPERPGPKWGAVIAALAALSHFLENTSGIKWGDGLEFAAVSSHLGVAHPPGYPLYTLLGWLMLRFPFAEPYQALLFLSKLSAAAVVMGLYVLLARPLRDFTNCGVIAGLFAAAFSFSNVLWPTVHVAEVYALSAALMVWAVALLTCDNSGGARVPHLFGGAVLGGLAVANHMTSLAILPVVVWAMARAWKERPARWVVLLSSALFVVVPAVLYLSLMLRVPTEEAAAHGIYWGAPRGFSDWFAHIRGGEYGQYQFLAPAPGQRFTLETYALFAFWRVVLVLHQVGGVFFGAGMASIAAGGLLVLAAGIHAKLMQRSSEENRRGLSILAAIMLQVVFVFLYNIPDIADYLLVPMMLLFPFVVLGICAVVGKVVRKSAVDEEESDFRVGRILAIIAAALAVVAFLSNKSTAHPATGPLAESWRQRLFAALPPGAGVITSTDADIYTIWYEQHARGQRLDVVAYGANFNRFPWFRMTMPPGDPRRDAVRFSNAPPTTLQNFIRNLNRDAVEPMLRVGPLYVLSARPEELDELSRYCRVEPAAELLTPQEIQLILQEGEVNFPPPVLFRITARQ